MQAIVVPMAKMDPQEATNQLARALREPIVRLNATTVAKRTRAKTALMAKYLS